MCFLRIVHQSTVVPQNLLCLENFWLRVWTQAAFFCKTLYLKNLKVFCLEIFLCHLMLYTISDTFRILRNHTEHSETLQNSICSGIFRHIKKYSGLLRHIHAYKGIDKAYLDLFRHFCIFTTLHYSEPWHI